MFHASRGRFSQLKHLVISTTTSRIEKYIVKGQVEGMVGVDIFKVTRIRRLI
jgi:hypothetical protein